MVSGKAALKYYQKGVEILKVEAEIYNKDLKGKRDTVIAVK